MAESFVYRPPTSPTSTMILSYFTSLPPNAPARTHFLTSLVGHCTPAELLHLSTLLAPRLKRDFLKDLPAELGLLVLSYVEDARTIARASCVSHIWRDVIRDASTWRRLSRVYGYAETLQLEPQHIDRPLPDPKADADIIRDRFRITYATERNWRTSGALLARNRTPDEGTITSLAMDAEWIVVGYENSQVNVYCTRIGAKFDTLQGHHQGVWALCLISAGGVDESNLGDNELRTASRRSDPCGASRGFGQSGARIISGSSDRTVRVWGFEPEDLATLSTASNASTTGSTASTPTRLQFPSSTVPQKRWRSLHTLTGHTATLRCMRGVHGRPLVVSGARDGTLRVWDIEAGVGIRLMRGHADSVRCLDVFGNECVSGSYDGTVRLWNVDTGACVRVFRGHSAPVYSVAYDGLRILSAGLDAVARVWTVPTTTATAPGTLIGTIGLSESEAAEDDACVARLMGHSSLICRVVIGDDEPEEEVGEDKAGTGLLVTGGADGRILVFGKTKSAPRPRSFSGLAQWGGASATDMDVDDQSPQPFPPSLGPSSPPSATSRSAAASPGVQLYTVTHRLSPHPSSSLSALQMLGPSVGCCVRDLLVSAASGGRVVLSDLRRPSSSAVRRPGERGSGAGTKQQDEDLDEAAAVSAGGHMVGSVRFPSATSSATVGAATAGAGMGVSALGQPIRTLGTSKFDTIWGAVAREDTLVIVGLRHSQSVVEIWRFRADD